MPRLFGVDIAGIVDGAMSSGLPIVTLVKVTTGTRDDNDPTAGNKPVKNNYKGRGFIDDYKDGQINDTSILSGDRKVTIIGNTLKGQVPTPGDYVIAEGITYSIIAVKRDPAAATYSCQVRGQ